MVWGKKNRLQAAAAVTAQNGWWSPVGTLGCCLTMSQKCYDVRHVSCETKSAKLGMQTTTVGYRSWPPKQEVHKITHFCFQNSLTFVLFLLPWQCRTAPLAAMIRVPYGRPNVRPAWKSATGSRPDQPQCGAGNVGEIWSAWKEKWISLHRVKNEQVHV